MNKLNKTESVVYLYCWFSLSEESGFFLDYSTLLLDTCIWMTYPILIIIILSEKVGQIYSAKLQINKASVSDNEAAFLTNDIIASKIYDKPDI